MDHLNRRRLHQYRFRAAIVVRKASPKYCVTVVVVAVIFQTGRIDGHITGTVRGRLMSEALSQPIGLETWRSKADAV